MSSPVLITGGTGTLGSLVVPRLLAAGRQPRVLSRRRREPEPGTEYVVGDLETGEGVDAAVAGVETVLHLAGSAKGDEAKARTLVAAASGAGVRHLVYISVVAVSLKKVTSGVDRAMFGYFAA
ncbi:SDR family oxidoreductase, partial [Actinophytocola xanthii]